MIKFLNFKISWTFIPITGIKFIFVIFKIDFLKPLSSLLELLSIIKADFTLSFSNFLEISLVDALLIDNLSIIIMGL